MKQLLLSQALRKNVPQQVIHELYSLLCTFPVSGMAHHFCISSSQYGTTIKHSVPELDFYYEINYSEKNISNSMIEIIAYDNCNKIMMAFYGEVN